MEESRTEYWEWEFSGTSSNHRYLLPALLRALQRIPGKRLLDIGCGNGALTEKISSAGFEITGIDFTSSGIERARQSFPHIDFREHDISRPLPEEMRGQFDVIISAEVIEHLFLPRTLFSRAREALGSAGYVVISTPYHGYWKNLALSAMGRCDSHWQVGSDFGHIKFFSESTLGEMAKNCGFEPVNWDRGGRIRPLAATMVMTGVLAASS